MRQALHAWIINHPNVIDSPIARDRLLITDPETGLKKRTGKLLLEISVRELHNALLEPSKKGGLACAWTFIGDVLISDTALRYLLPPQLRPMTERHKQMSVRSFQSTLNAWRFRHTQRLDANSVRFTEYSGTVLPNGKHWHPKPKDAVQEIQCPTVGNLQFPHWKCVLRRCTHCPEYPIPVEEQGVTDNDQNTPQINFHVYLPFTSCTIHDCELLPNAKKCPKCVAIEALPTPAKVGKVRTRKHLTLLKRRIGLFFKD
jgi:hypothetical protein